MGTQGAGTESYSLAVAERKCDGALCSDVLDASELCRDAQGVTQLTVSSGSGFARISGEALHGGLAGVQLAGLEGLDCSSKGLQPKTPYVSNRTGLPRAHCCADCAVVVDALVVPWYVLCWGQKQKATR